MDSLSGRRMGDGGRYVIQKQIAVGDTGTIFLAQDTHSQSLVAIKLIHNNLVSNKRIRELFLKMAQALTELHHPNIVDILDIIDENGSIALVMPFIKGVSLDHHLEEKGGHLDFSQALEIMTPVMETVQFAHERGVVHRNLKPGNIMLDFFDGKAVPKVLDFGIANILAANTGRSKVKTVIGTPTYMSPEQLKGSADMDGRGDVYALGAIWYQILTGQLPYGEGSEYEVTNRILSGEPLNPIKVKAKDPESVEHAIFKAMAPDRNNRFANVREFLVAISISSVEDVWKHKPARVIYPEIPASTQMDELVSDENIPSETDNLAPEYLSTRNRTYTYRKLLIPFITIIMVIMLAGMVAGVWSMKKQSDKNSEAERLHAEKIARDKRERQEEIKKAEEEKLRVKQELALKAGQVELDSNGIEWAYIPYGSFQMGCSGKDDTCDGDSNPPHVVKVEAFQIMTHEVTQGEYRTLIGIKPSHFKDCGDDCPVERIDWYEARKVCQKIGGRLPTEAEWEYAARAGTVTRYYCGDDCLDGIAWHGGNSNGQTHTVMGKMPNAWGLYDVLGNVWEWVEDCYSKPYEVVSDCSVNVLRGGAWNLVGRMESMEIRYILNPVYRYYSNGVRCARDLPS